MLLTLNDDCLHKLCEYLNLIDRISLLNTCERLRTVVQCYYKSHNKVTFKSDILELECKDRRKILKDFGTHIDPYIEEISLEIENNGCIFLSYLSLLPSWDKIKEINDKTNYEYENPRRIVYFFKKMCTQLKTFENFHEKLLGYLKDCEFSNLINLTIKGDYNEKVLNVTAKMFPKLENLNLEYCEINFENLKDFKNLKKLKTFTWDLTPVNPKLIFSLPTLEKLEIHCYGNFKNIEGISACENLKELVIHDIELADLQLDELLKLKNVKKIKFSWENNLIFPVHPNLVYHAIEIYTLPIIDWNQMLKLRTKFRDVFSLKLFMPEYKLVANFRPSLNYFIEILKHCKNLRILELCGSMNCAAILLEEANNVYECSFFEERGRKNLIYFNIFINEKEEEGVSKIMKLSLPNFIQLFWRSDCYFEDSTVDCKWVVNNY